VHPDGSLGVQSYPLVISLTNPLMKFQPTEPHLLDELNILHSAEIQKVAVLPKLSRLANPDVQAAIQEHFEEAQVHLVRLGQILESLGRRRFRTRHNAMRELLCDGLSQLDDDTEPHVRSIMILKNLERADQYLTFRYGFARWLATKVSQRNIVELLDQCLDDERSDGLMVNHLKYQCLSTLEAEMTGAPDRATPPSTELETPFALGLCLASRSPA
jgi:ferritin-like metal-binding protein YciE